MLKSISLKRFKSICNESALPLDLFSILCGSNSSGKSSLIQAILFMSQSLSSRYDRSSFILNGPLTKLGSISDVRSHFSNEKSFEVKFTLSGGRFPWYIDPDDTVEVRLLLGKRNSYDGSLDDELHPTPIECDVTFIGRIDGSSSLQTIQVYDDTYNKQPHPQAVDTAPIFKIKHFDIDSIPVLAEEFPELTPIGFERDGIIPKNLVFSYDKTKRTANRIIPFLCGSRTAMLGGFFLELSEEKLRLPPSFIDCIQRLIKQELETLSENFVLPEALSKAMRSNTALQRSVDFSEVKKQLISQKFPLTASLFDSLKNTPHIQAKAFKAFVQQQPKEISFAILDLLKRHQEILKDAWYAGTEKETAIESQTIQIFDKLEDFIVAYFSRAVRYLGPLRIEPQANYPSTGLADPKNVGLKGENTAAVLHVNKGRNIRYSSPLQDDDGRLTLKESATPLDVACKTWLTYLGVARDFVTVDTGKMGHLLRVKTHSADQWQDMTHVGVGVSQVLPIILMALLSDAGDMLIFEQPELHLHPRVQSRLCDFFIAVALSGRQCLIETHSEYLITRLRARIAQSEDDKIKNISSIYFVNKHNSASQFEKVDISRYGAIENWPKDFFDDNNKEVEQIIREAALKRKRDRIRAAEEQKNREDQ
ncbi:DUF3696 domain-containing protein [Pseudomonas sp. S75]|uniref:DUF3696 domain-containing protein n=1 Tax=unclassified Pseudomonas TaxID=196821 RepID=UPI0019047D05|nr:MULTISPECIES: DUF3696 domain-containing protein [unclassified Pseudomonas]MBJ9975260.1 DUF3696 domain-containing protein [Pseudomonas sp. S30]MBK0152766.1 DUF3696 domain-containing protein [Pseudomonas sp. S75]